MKRLLLFLISLFLSLFLTKTVNAQVNPGNTSCSVSDITAGQIPPNFSGTGFEPNHNYAIQVTCVGIRDCQFNRTFCVASDAQGKINAPLTGAGVKFEINGTYQAVVGEVRSPIPCSRDTSTPYCSPLFQVTGAQRDFPGSCTVTREGGVCKVATDQCNKAAGYVAKISEGGREGTACSCSCVKEGEGTKAAGYEPTYCDPPANTEIKTALGCIPVGNTTDFIAWFLRWAIGIAGGIAFLLILFAGFQIITSSGDPERLKAGKELLTSAIAGLILIIFSVFLLRLIGVEILRIPGFGG